MKTLERYFVLGLEILGELNKMTLKMSALEIFQFIFRILIIILHYYQGIEIEKKIH